MKSKKLILMLMAATVLLGLSIYKVAINKVKPTVLSLEQVNPKIIQYQGIEGKNAFELLKAKNQVVSKESSFGAFVSEINGIKNTDKEFWMFYVNGELAKVAADKYITKNTDKIEWRFEAMK